MMDVDLICNHNVATIGKSRGIVDAAELMRQEHVGDLIVVETRAGAQVPVGILTDRDIIVGVIAVDDIIEHFAQELGQLAKLIRIEQDAEQRTRP